MSRRRRTTSGPSRHIPRGTWRAGAAQGGAIARSNGERPVGAEVHTPLFGVQAIVMMAAEWQQIVQVGMSAVLPESNVVRLDSGDVAATARDGTGAEHGAQGPALLGTGMPAATAVNEADRPFE